MNADLSDLYRYQNKRIGIAMILALLAGIAGAHRFYMGKTFTGVLMLLTGGGGLIWWIADLFRLRKMVDAHNEEERARESEGLAPQALAFLPAMKDLHQVEAPAWEAKRAGRATLVGGGVLLFFIGTSMAAVAGSTGVLEPLVTMIAFIVITLLGPYWSTLESRPGLGGVARWYRRLTLYYRHTDPGSVSWLAVRPLAGAFFAPFFPKARAEVRLHLQMGVVFSLLLTLTKLSGPMPESLAAQVGLMFGEFVQTVVYTYVFVAPMGAILTTQRLLNRSARTMWLLCALTMCGMLFGLWSIGLLG